MVYRALKRGPLSSTTFLGETVAIVWRLAHYQLRTTGKVVTYYYPVEKREEVCQYCGRHKRIAAKVNGKKACSGCYDRLRPARRNYNRPRETCRSCSRLRPVCTRDKKGPICHTCYSNDPKRKEVCRYCEEKRRVQHEIKMAGPSAASATTN